MFSPWTHHERDMGRQLGLQGVTPYSSHLIQTAVWSVRVVILVRGLTVFRSAGDQDSSKYRKFSVYHCITGTVKFYNWRHKYRE